MDRALLVGINKYPGNELRGCVNDVTDMAKFLSSKCVFSMNSIRLLTDGRATKTAIADHLKFLVEGAKPGDRLVFHYSGHGAQMPTRNPSAEVDRLDEVICPVNFDWSDEHAIRDKEFVQIFSSVPAGVKFVWISDSCHSGDLSKEFPKLKQAGKHKTIMPPADIDWRLQTAKHLIAREPAKIQTSTLAKAAAGLNVVLIAGCKSNETSADAVFNRRPNGALTYFLLKELAAPKGLKEPLTDLVRKTGKDVSQYSSGQHPQLEGSKELAAKSFLG